MIRYKDNVHEDFIDGFSILSSCNSTNLENFRFEVEEKKTLKRKYPLRNRELFIEDDISQEKYHKLNLPPKFFPNIPFSISCSSKKTISKTPKHLSQSINKTSIKSKASKRKRKRKRKLNHKFQFKKIIKKQFRENEIPKNVANPHNIKTDNDAPNDSKMVIKLRINNGKVINASKNNDLNNSSSEEVPTKVNTSDSSLNVDKLMVSSAPIDESLAHKEKSPENESERTEVAEIETNDEHVKEPMIEKHISILNHNQIGNLIAAEIIKSSDTTMHLDDEGSEDTDLLSFENKEAEETNNEKGEIKDIDKDKDNSRINDQYGQLKLSSFTAEVHSDDTQKITNQQIKRPPIPSSQIEVENNSVQSQNQSETPIQSTDKYPVSEKQCIFKDLPRLYSRWELPPNDTKKRNFKSKSTSNCNDDRNKRNRTQINIYSDIPPLKPAPDYIFKRHKLGLPLSSDVINCPTKNKNKSDKNSGNRKTMVANSTSKNVQKPNTKPNKTRETIKIYPLISTDRNVSNRNVQKQTPNQNIVPYNTNNPTVPVTTFSNYLASPWVMYNRVQYHRKTKNHVDIANFIYRDKMHRKFQHISRNCINNSNNNINNNTITGTGLNLNIQNIPNHTLTPSQFSSLKRFHHISAFTPRYNNIAQKLIPLKPALYPKRP